LIRKEHVRCRYGVFKVRVSSVAHEKNRSQMSGLSKLNSVNLVVEVDVISRRAWAPDDRSHRRARRLRE